MTINHYNPGYSLWDEQGEQFVPSFFGGIPFMIEFNLIYTLPKIDKFFAPKVF